MKMILVMVALMTVAAPAYGWGSVDATGEAARCTRAAMDGLRGRHDYPDYAEAAEAIAEVAWGEAGRGEYPLTVCQLAAALATISWWETSWRPRGGGAGEYGLTQVRPCESYGPRHCAEGGFDPSGRKRPTAAWLAESPQNSLRYTAARLQRDGLSLETFRRYNGSGPLARAYARRAWTSLGAAQFRQRWDWAILPRTPALPRNVRAENTPWHRPVPGEPRGNW